MPDQVIQSIFLHVSGLRPQVSINAESSSIFYQHRCKSVVWIRKCGCVTKGTQIPGIARGLKPAFDFGFGSASLTRHPVKQTLILYRSAIAPSPQGWDI